MRDMTKIDSMDSDSLSLVIDEIEKERMAASQLLDTVTIKKLELEKSLSVLRIAIQKGRQNIRKLNSEKEITERAYWRSRGK